MKGLNYLLIFLTFLIIIVASSITQKIDISNTLFNSSSYLIFAYISSISLTVYIFSYDDEQCLPLPKYFKYMPILYLIKTNFFYFRYQTNKVDISDMYNILFFVCTALNKRLFAEANFYNSTGKIIISDKSFKDIYQREGFLDLFKWTFVFSDLLQYYDFHHNIYNISLYSVSNYITFAVFLLLINYFQYNTEVLLVNIGFRDAVLSNCISFKESFCIRLDLLRYSFYIILIHTAVFVLGNALIYFMYGSNNNDVSLIFDLILSDLSFFVLMYVIRPRKVERLNKFLSIEKFYIDICFIEKKAIKDEYNYLRLNSHLKERISQDIFIILNPRIYYELPNKENDAFLLKGMKIGIKINF